MEAKILKSTKMLVKLGLKLQRPLTAAFVGKNSQTSAILLISNEGYVSLSYYWLVIIVETLNYPSVCFHRLIYTI